MNWNVFFAIFKRNFVNYFASPTGYVFICAFVALSSFAAFWPNEFFNANLANLDQLNKYLPFIMLVFIPAITMSIWAEERRQGTDELLLTIPATDLDVVLGKFAAATGIFSVTLAYSMFFNGIVLSLLGSPDLGLFIGTYIGYWLTGVAMVSIGMVASFLTSNLTVGFVLGALFNAPLALSSMAEAIIPSPAIAQQVQRWSMAAQLRDLERGVLSISSFSYFVMIVVVMLYLAVVLIGRRHWLGGRDGSSLAGHYLARTLSLVLLAVGINLFLSYHDFIRPDITSEQLSSLSSDTRKLIKDLDTKQPVVIEAFISPEVPTEYVPTRLNLISMLDELSSLGDEKIQVKTHIIENFSDEAVRAEQTYGITPRQVFTKSRGAMTQEEIFMGVAFKCGLEREVLRFVDKGLPPEYELVRSICTVAQPERLKIGILQTDAQLFGQFNMQTMSNSSDQMIVEELRKQYEVVQVDANEPIKQDMDVLLAVQPSTLTPPQMENFIAAVKRGQPTAIFEDPLPVAWGNVVGTDQQRRQQQNPMMRMMGQSPPPAPPKGEITKLWDLLGVDLIGDQIVWQAYNPYPKAQGIVQPEWVFVDNGNGAKAPFNPDQPISAGLQQVLFLFPGRWDKQNKSKLEFEELAVTGESTGTIEFKSLMQAGQPGGGNLANLRDITREQYVLAVHVRGKPPVDGLLDEGKGAHKTSEKGAGVFSVADAAENAEEEQSDPADEETSVDDKKSADDEASADEDPEINVVLVADIDCLMADFFRLRARGQEADDEVQWDMDNVTFVLNTIDYLANDERYMNIRTRRRPHRTLTTIDKKTEAAREEAGKERKKFNDEFEQERAAAQTEYDERVAAIDKRTDLGPVQRQIERMMVTQDAQRRQAIKMKRIEQKRDDEIKKIERQLTLGVRRVQDNYKLGALLLPPIPPLIVGIFVFFHRRSQEQEGVARSRLR